MSKSIFIESVNPFDLSDSELKEAIQISWSSASAKAGWGPHAQIATAILNDRSSRRNEKSALWISIVALIVAIATPIVQVILGCSK